MRARILCGLSLLLAVPCFADDWPQWRGPQRDGIWREAGVTTELADDLAPTWKTPIGLGYAGPAVVGGKVLVFDYEKTGGEITNNPGGRDKLEGNERLLCLDAATGKEVWKHEYDCPYELSYPSGPRCTPTVDGEHVFTLGAMGDLHCVKLADGEVVWKKNFTADFGAETPVWGHSAHPLVHGDLVICMVGGEGSIVVAFNKETGEEAWRALSAYEPGYCPPSLVNHAGMDMVIIFHPAGVSALDPLDGKELWNVPMNPQYGMSIAAPQLQGSSIFVSCYGDSAMLNLNRDQPAADIAWRSKPKESVYCSNSTPFFAADAIYGCDIEASTLVAVNPADGQRLWESNKPTIGDARGRHGTAFIVQHEPTGKYWLFSENGDLIVADLSPQEYKELGRMHVLDPTSDAFGRPVVWSHPAFAEQSVFARNDKEIVRVSLAE